ncbi:MAG: haloacid dehalogenase type II [Rhodospirillales bacterium]|nr:haloacid dehalogenase type II [Rhodospirillales bacterium]
MLNKKAVKAVIFDTFGTVVDWRSSIAREARAAAQSIGIEDFDGDSFADAWRAGYHPKMKEVRDGVRPWTTNDVLHRERLEDIVADFGLDALDEAARFDLNRAWHRLAPWPDSVPGISRLKNRYIVSTFSNGSFGLLVNLSKNAKIPWDGILCSDVFRAFKPARECYLGAIELLGGEPQSVMLCAAHNYDLSQGRKYGMQTAYVDRPLEYGPNKKTDLKAEQDWEIIATSIEQVADALDC